ncbi:MAG TPA: class I tRNA ligase family protein, partial [Planctomycetaceae bacterium]
AHLVARGARVKIPLNGREIPIVADAILVDRNLGTGAVKVTPAHDPNDYAFGQRHKHEPINILNPDGTLNENAGRWQGLDRYEARKQVVAEMEKLGHLEKIEDRDIEIAHSDRSKTPIEPYLSDQWFVKMDTLAENAMNAVRTGKVRFFPPRYTKTYLDWLGEKRDWCISRQLWWGHRIPVWRRTQLSNPEQVAKYEYLQSEVLKLKGEFGDDADVQEIQAELIAKFQSSRVSKNKSAGQHVARQHFWYPESGLLDVLYAVEAGHPEVERELEADGFVQEEDVLDTWFSSALWPHATLGWPDRDHNPPLNNQPDPHQTGHNEVLDYFYPGSVLITSRDIITLWVARMVIMGLYNMGDIPFRHVHVHPKILDGFGQTMSKTKGNGVDPMDLFDKYGVDAVRFTITSFAGENQDVRLPVGYECPHCSEVIPQTLEHQMAKPGGGDKPRVKCPKCKKTSQYSSPWFAPDEGEPVARVVSERFEYGRNFCNKLWNASRFAIMNLEGYTPGPIADSDLLLEDRWVLS